MERERRWFRMPRALRVPTVPQPGWWRRRDVSQPRAGDGGGGCAAESGLAAGGGDGGPAARPQAPRGSPPPSPSDPPESELTESSSFKKANSAEPETPTGSHDSELPSISFSFFAETEMMLSSITMSKMDAQDVGGDLRPREAPPPPPAPAPSRGKPCEDAPTPLPAISPVPTLASEQEAQSEQTGSDSATSAATGSPARAGHGAITVEHTVESAAPRVDGGLGEVPTSAPVTVPTSPNTDVSPFPAPASPIAAPASPTTVPASPVTAPASPVTAPASPVTAPASPITAPASPFSAPASPVTAPASPITTPGTPVTAPASPVTASPSPPPLPQQDGYPPASLPSCTSSVASAIPTTPPSPQVPPMVVPVVLSSPPLPLSPIPFVSPPTRFPPPSSPPPAVPAPEPGRRLSDELALALGERSSSEGQYEVLRVGSLPSTHPVVGQSTPLCVEPPQYASPRASYVQDTAVPAASAYGESTCSSCLQESVGPVYVDSTRSASCPQESGGSAYAESARFSADWEGSEAYSLGYAQLTSSAGAGGPGAETGAVSEGGRDYEELEYCAARAAQRRAAPQRVGRAWRALRGWVRAERSRLARVVRRHARAHGAFAAAPPTPPAPGAAPATAPPPPPPPPAVPPPRADQPVVAASPGDAVARRRRPRPASRAGLVRSRYVPEGQNGFEELRRFIKQGGDFCKDLSAILQERSEAETQYAKTLSKLSGKLLKASKDSVGSVNQAWQHAGAQMEAQSEAHRAFAAALSEEVVKPLRQLLDSQHRTRKSVESVVDKTSKSLSEWRTAEAKSKKQSFLSARENEKLQDVSLDVRLGRTPGSVLHHNHKQISDKECTKLESKRKKAEQHVKKADIEYYTFCIRAERARLEWETAVIRGSQCFQALEKERLEHLKVLASCYLNHMQNLGPKIAKSADKMIEPIQNCDVSRDLQTVVSLKGTGQPIPEQLLPDFYAEHITLAMNCERRRQALVKILQLIRQDIERERRGKQGVESLARALQQTPNFGAEDSQQNLSEKLHHMRSMLTYLEAARYKVHSALAEIDGRPRASHPLAPHIQVTRDKQGLQQSVLKVPLWVRKESFDQLAEESSDWMDRGAGDGNSVQPDSDFDEFSSQGSEKDYQSSVMTYPVISGCNESSPVSGGQCRALYEYVANLYDELNLRPGDIINIHNKQADGWWLGELNGVIGIFPATYVEEIK